MWISLAPIYGAKCYEENTTEWWEVKGMIAGTLQGRILLHEPGTEKLSGTAKLLGTKIIILLRARPPLRSSLILFSATQLPQHCLAKVHPDHWSEWVTISQSQVSRKIRLVQLGPADCPWISWADSQPRLFMRQGEERIKVASLRGYQVYEVDWLRTFYSLNSQWFI